MKLQKNIFTVLWTALLQSSFAANCNLKPSYPAPVVANGWQARPVTQGLKSPRSIVFDSNGGLLIVQQWNGIVHLQLTDGGGACFDVAKKTTLVEDSSVSD
jgi:glucose/arabinose dehydrogenase